MSAKASLKSLSKSAVDAAAERVEEVEGAESNELYLSAILAAESIAVFEAQLEAAADGSADEEVARDLKRVRKLLRRNFVPKAGGQKQGETSSGEGPSKAQDDTVAGDLGQYATATGSLKGKAAGKFARLLGAAKPGAEKAVSAPRTVMAASPEEEERRQKALQSQFENAAARKGKLKGLGK
jgi:hypothetical protein